MDTQAYIDSGVLELYVLDRLAPEQRAEVEQYADQYPEIRAEISHIETALEEYVILHGQTTPPSPAVLTKVLAGIQAGGGAPPSAGGTNTVNPVADTRRGGPMIWLALLLAALGLAAAVYLWQESNDRQQQITELEQNLATVREQCDLAEQQRQQVTRQLASLRLPETQNIILGGTENAPESRAVVFYNQETGQTLFSAVNLPAPPTGKQYQLWAIDGEGPQDLGVLDRNLSGEVLLEVPYVPGAAAFAITLEDEGGKPTPDLTTLQVIGEVSS